jgi:hypothetical protein
MDEIAPRNVDYSDEPNRAPRFPYVGLLLCLGCVGMAAYLWMRYSWAWEVTGVPPSQWRLGQYVLCLCSAPRPSPYGADLEVYEGEARPEGLFVPPYWCNIVDDGNTVLGRVIGWGNRWAEGDERGTVLSLAALDTTASRWHPASIAGLVVGAMGVFVFGTALRQWRRERRAYGEGDV